TRLGEVETGTDNLKEAEETFHSALEVCTRESNSLSWATIYAALGVTLTRVAERELVVQGPLQSQIIRNIDTQQPTDWVTRQQELTLGLNRIQQRENGLSHLEEAITAFRNSLEELPRDRLPLHWANTQHDFSTALARFGEQEDGTEYLLQALSAVNSALEVWTYEDFPFFWALGQNTLGWILIRLGERETDTSILRLESAVGACRKSLQVQTRDALPFQWALTQNTLAIAHYRLGQACMDIVHFNEAATAFSSALDVWRALSADNYIESVGNNLRNVQVLMQ